MASCLADSYCPARLEHRILFKAVELAQFPHRSAVALGNAAEGVACANLIGLATVAVVKERLHQDLQVASRVRLSAVRVCILVVHDAE